MTKKHEKHTVVEVPVPASGSVSEASKVVQTKVETQEVHSCGECKFYDVSTQRDFHRDGIRKDLIECRAICRASNEHTKASGHLVKKESDRPCFERGVYVAPVNEKKTKKEHPVELNETTVERKASKKHGGASHAVATNGLSGDTKILEKNGHDKKVIIKGVA